MRNGVQTSMAKMRRNGLERTALDKTVRSFGAVKPRKGNVVTVRQRVDGVVFNFDPNFRLQVAGHHRAGHWAGLMGTKLVGPKNTQPGLTAPQISDLAQYLKSM